MPRRHDMREWTAADIEAVKVGTEAGQTGREIAEALGRTTSAVQNIRVRYGFRAPINGRPPMIRPVAEYTPPEGKGIVEVLAPMASADEPEDRFIERYMTTARRKVQRAEARKFVTIKIPSATPVALVITSDWHVSDGCDLDKLMALAKLVARTPNMYALVGGDQGDNNIKHKGSNVHGILDESRMLEIVVREFMKKILAWVSGNHDDWTKVLAGLDALLWLSQKHRIHYEPDEMIFCVQIVAPHDEEQVTAEYHIALRHQWRRHSALNPTHACKTWLQEQVMNWPVIPDVLAIGHNHVAAVGSEQYSGKDVHYLRMGSFQRDSAYARAKGFADYRPTAPTVVLPPVQGRIVSFADPEDAIVHMRGWRDVAA